MILAFVVIGCAAAILLAAPPLVVGLLVRRFATWIQRRP